MTEIEETAQGLEENEPKNVEETKGIKQKDDNIDKNTLPDFRLQRPSVPKNTSQSPLMKLFVWLVLPCLLGVWVFQKFQEWNFGKCPFHLFLMNSCPPPDLGVDFQDIPNVMISTEELAKHDGIQDEKLWLCILGEVFDVTAGPMYYGEEGGYRGFVGKDASRAFVLGGFEGEVLIPDTSDLTPEQCSGVWHWVKFYRESNIYHAIGKYPGWWYDEEGNPTEKLENFVDKLAEADKIKEEQKNLQKQFPRCNRRSGKGIKKVWCTKRSGGVKREVAGFPRSFKENPQANPRCACIQEKDLGDGRVQEYDNCNSDSSECFLS